MKIPYWWLHNPNHRALSASCVHQAPVRNSQFTVAQFTVRLLCAPRACTQFTIPILPPVYSAVVRNSKFMVAQFTVRLCALSPRTQFTIHNSQFPSSALWSGTQFTIDCGTNHSLPPVCTGRPYAIHNSQFPSSAPCTEVHNSCYSQFMVWYSSHVAPSGTPLYVRNSQGGEQTNPLFARWALRNVKKTTWCRNYSV